MKSLVWLWFITNLLSENDNCSVHCMSVCDYDYIMVSAVYTVSSVFSSTQTRCYCARNSKSDFGVKAGRSRKWAYNFKTAFFRKGEVVFTGLKHNTVLHLHQMWSGFKGFFSSARRAFLYIVARYSKSDINAVVLLQCTIFQLLQAQVQSLANPLICETRTRQAFI